MDVETTTRRHGGVTLVEVQLRTDRDAPRTVSVENRLDGPVWYPRRHGEAGPGWDEGGYEGTVPANGTLALGYACPAPPAEPAVEVKSADSMDSERRGADVVAELGDPRPPRDAVGNVDAEQRDPIPAPVAAWLDEVAAGRRDQETAAALDAVATRVDQLREETIR